MRKLALAGAHLGALCGLQAEGAQPRPSRAIRDVVRQAPVGSCALLARTVAARLCAARAPAATAIKRSATARELPTVAKSGGPGCKAIAWPGVLGPADAPRDVVQRLHAKMVKVLAQHDARRQLAEQGHQPAGATPEQFSQFIRVEIARWSKVVAASGIAHRMISAAHSKRTVMKLTPIVCAAALAACAGAAAAADYPSKPIRLVVPFTPGGGNDIAARFIAQKLTEAFNHTAVVDNRPGAGSTLGTDLVAKSAPDGYTLLVTHNAIAINPTLYSKLPFDTLRDFVQVIEIGATTNTLVVNPSVPARSVKDFIALAKSKPGALNYASTGAGGTSMLAMEYFKLETGTNIVHIPYKGTAPALTDVVAGQVQCMISALPGTIPFINSKRVIALATTGKERSIFAKDLPTLNEAGVKGYEFDTFYGLHAPAKTPKAIIEKLNAALAKSLARDDVKEQLAKQGLEAVGGTSDAFAKKVKVEIQKMGKIIKASGAKPEGQ